MTSKVKNYRVHPTHRLISTQLNTMKIQIHITRIELHFLTKNTWAAIIATAAAVLLPANRSAIFITLNDTSSRADLDGKGVSTVRRDPDPTSMVALARSKAVPKVLRAVIA